MAETLNETKANITEDVQETQARTFTQEEVNRMIEVRLGKERGKFSDYEELKAKASRFDEIEEANKSELQKATERADELQSRLDEMTRAEELRKIKTQVSTETGVPANLLTGSTVEECKAQAEALLAWSKPSGYPSVKDGGETTVSPITKAEILAIKDERARLKAIQENINLFE